MRDIARGEFDIAMVPQETGRPNGRMTIDKTYRGALEATAIGEMMTATTAVEGSAAYVAIETVTGRLDGRAGSFALVHRGVMSAEAQSLSIEVVPDSGTDDLTGLVGEMRIEREGGQHHYVFSYALE